MNNIKEILSNCDKEYAMVDTINQLCNLLDNDKILEAKEMLYQQIHSLLRNAPNHVMYNILQMVDTYASSDKKVDDVIKYHNSYTSILDSTMYGTRWVYGNNYEYISNICSAVVETINNLLPDKYDTLLTHTSAYDYDIMVKLYKDIDDKIIQWVSNIMMLIEVFDVYLVHHVLMEYNGMSVKDILDACDKLDQDSE